MKLRASNPKLRQRSVTKVAAEENHKKPFTLDEMMKRLPMTGNKPPPLLYVPNQEIVAKLIKRSTLVQSVEELALNY